MMFYGTVYVIKEIRKQNNTIYCVYVSELFCRGRSLGPLLPSRVSAHVRVQPRQSLSPSSSQRPWVSRYRDRDTVDT